MRTHALRPSFETSAGTSFEGSLLYLGRKGTAERTGEGARAPKGRCSDRTRRRETTTTDGTHDQAPPREPNATERPGYRPAGSNRSR
jgi:hypothetical protein